MRSTGTEAGKKHSMKEYILTPVNAAIVVGLIMFIFQLRFPAPVDNAVQGMSSLTTPMAMLYVGTILTKSSIKDVFSDWRTYACSFVRLVLIPLLVLMIARPLIHDPMIYGVLVIGHAMPVAGFCAIFAGEYGNDVVLEYQVPEDVQDLSLMFGREDYYDADAYQEFAGTIEIYNYRAGRYEKVSEEDELTGDRLEQCISLDHRLLLRYRDTTVGSDKSDKLPILIMKGRI